MKAILEPNVGISSFIIGENIEKYKNIYPYNFLNGEDNENWDEYDFFDEQIEVYVDKESGLIESIACRISCFYMGIDLIDYDFNDFLKLISIEENTLEREQLWMTDDEQQTAYQIDQLLLQVWVDFRNKIKAIFIG
jgi:hypothetical protein